MESSERIDELEERVARMEDRVRELEQPNRQRTPAVGVSSFRRGLLKGVGGIVGLNLLTSPSSATATHPRPKRGSSADSEHPGRARQENERQSDLAPRDDPIRASNVLTESKFGTVVIWKDDEGTVYAVGEEELVDSGDEDGAIIQAALDSFESGIVLIKSGFYDVADQIRVTGKNHWEMIFEKGARFARDDGTEEGKSLSIENYVIEVTASRRGGSENYRIVNPQITNDAGGIHVDRSAWFSIVEPDIKVSTGTAIGVDRSNSFRIHGGGELLGGASSDNEGKGVHVGTMPDPGDNTTAVNDWAIEIDRIVSFETGVQIGQGRTDNCENGTVSATIESCRDGLKTMNSRNLHVFDAWFERNDTAVRSENAGEFLPDATLSIQNSYFTGNDHELVIEGYFTGRIVEGKTNNHALSVEIEGPEFRGTAHLRSEPETFTGPGRYLINGAGIENLGESPSHTPSDTWPEGSVIRNSNPDNDETWGLLCGTWVKLR